MPPIVEYPDGLDFEIGGNANQVCPGVSDNDKPASTADFKTTIDQGANAGTYYLWYYVDGGDDYNTTDVNGTAVTKAIGKAAATLTCNNSAISFSSTEAKNSPKTLDHTPAVSGKNWIYGTKAQYSRMWGGGSGCSSWSDFNTKITNAGGTALGLDSYWSCSEYDSSRDWYFGDGGWYYGGKDPSRCVRPCFAF